MVRKWAISLIRPAETSRPPRILQLRIHRLTGRMVPKLHSAGLDFRETLGKIPSRRSACSIAPLALPVLALSRLGKQVRQQLPVSEPPVENSS
jgi:hypothetical protein